MGTHVDLSIVELVCSRLCHDMVGPVGAATNGLELLRDVSSGLHDDIIDMTDTSARTAWRRLEFFRVALGWAGGRGGWGTGELAHLAQNMLRDGKVRLDWQCAADVTALEGRGGKLVLNLILLIAESMARGGTLTLRLQRQGDSVTGSLCSEGQNAALNPRIGAAVQGRLPAGDLDSRVILAHMAWLQMTDAGADVVWDFSDHRIAASLTIPQPQTLASAAE